MFYKKYNIPGLNDCDPTSEFCQKFNDCFDALDRKFGAEGLRVNGKDYQVKINFYYVFTEIRSTYICIPK